MERARKISKKYYLRQIMACWLSCWMLFGIPVQVVMADPNPGSNVIPGPGNVISTSPGTGLGWTGGGVDVGINSNAGNNIITWNNFDIGENATLTFNQASGWVLNNVQAGDAMATGIFGDLFGPDCGLIVVNPLGVVFGPDSLVQAQNFIASSLSISDADFMNGIYSFTGGGVGEVANYGSISAEQVALIGKKVLNAGVIRSPGGYVLMAAGDRVFLGQEGSDVVVEVGSVTVPQDTPIEGLGDVINEGTIEAAGGKIVLAAGDTFSRAIDGLDSLSLAVSGGTGRVGQFGTINADGVEGDGGSVTLTAADVVALGSDSVTTANAGTNGNGGEVIVYSPEMALFRPSALVEAKGGSQSGDGGFFEISGHEYVEVVGQIDLTAENGAKGQFVIDPYNIKIVDGGSDYFPLLNWNWGLWDPGDSEWNPRPSPLSGYSRLDIDWLEYYLYKSDVTISTDSALPCFPGSQEGWVIFDAGRDVVSEKEWKGRWTKGPWYVPANTTSDNSLTVNANAFIQFMPDSGIDFAGSGNVTLNAGSHIDIGAGIDLRGGGSFEAYSGLNTPLYADILADNYIKAGSILLDASAGILSNVEAKELTATVGNIEIAASDWTIHLHGNVDTDTYDAGDIILHNHTVADDGVKLDAGHDVILYCNKTLTGDGDLDVKAGNIIDFGGDVYASGYLNLDAGVKTYAAGDIGAGGALTVEGDLELDGDPPCCGRRDQTVYSQNGTLTINGATLKSTGGNLTLLSGDQGEGSMYTRDVTVLDGRLTAEAQGRLMLDGDIRSKNKMTLTSNSDEIDGPGSESNILKAYGTLTTESCLADIEITAKNSGIYLYGDVDAGRDLLLNNYTYTSSAGLTLEAGRDVKVKDNYMLDAAGNLLVEAGDNIILGQLRGRNQANLITLDAGDNVVVNGTVDTTTVELGYNGDLVVEAGDNIMFGDDVAVKGSLVARAGLDIAPSWCPSSGEGFIEAAGDITAADMLLTAGYGWPGYEVSTPTQTYVHVAGMLTSTAGDITVGARHDIVLGGADVDGTWTSVDAAGNLTLDGDWHSLLYGDGYKGGDVTVDGAINTGGSTNAYGNNITIGGDVQAGGDIILTAGTSSDFADPSPEGDVTAYGDLTSTGGSVEIYSDGDTTYLWGDVLAADNVLLNNNTKFMSGDDQHVVAGEKVTAEGWLKKWASGDLYLLGGSDELAVDLKHTVSTYQGNLWIIGNGDVQIGDDLTTFGEGDCGPGGTPCSGWPTGGVLIYSHDGKIYTEGGLNDTLNVSITGNSDHWAELGVYDISQYGPDYDGVIPIPRAAIAIISKEDLKIGAGAELRAYGKYYDDVDDRSAINFLTVTGTEIPAGYPRDAGVPFDLAIYVASTGTDTLAGQGDVDVSAPVSILSREPVVDGDAFIKIRPAYECVPKGAMVIDARDTVTFDGGVPGGLFETSLADGDVGDRLEVVSRITEWLEDAVGRLPYASGGGPFPLGYNYVLRGAGAENPAIGDGAPAWVLTSRNLAAPLGVPAIPVILGCPAEMEAAAGELGLTRENIQVAMTSALAQNPSMQPCEACRTLINSAAILSDADAVRVAAMVEIFNTIAPADAPFTPEMAASIATAFAEGMADPEAPQYATAMEYVDAFVAYVTVLETELGAPVGDSAEFAMAKYGTPLTESGNANIASYIGARLAAL